MGFTIYIDESGEAGVAQVREGNSPGASPYFVLGAAVFQPAAEILSRNTFNDFRERIGKKSWKHATDLNHPQKVLLARTIGGLPIRLFSVISNKATLREYKETINSDPQKFYNKCVVYLLERICKYLLHRVSDLGELRVIFERRNHDYDRMLRYVDKVKNNPIYEESKVLKTLNTFSISTKAKGEDDLLDIADFVAHAVYQLGNKIEANFNIPESRYFQEMMSRFAGGPKGLVTEAGLKCIHTLDQLEFDNDVAEIVRTARSKPPASRI